MVTFNAHFDGKVIVPDEPVSLTPNQKLRIRIEVVDANVGDTAKTPAKVDFSKLLGLGLKGSTHPNPRFPDEDSLWEGTTGNFLENGPNKPSMKKPAP
jgi:hypothetical protein